MKVLIVSDIHGNFKNMKKAIQNNSSFDYVFILGDILSGPNMDGYDPEKLANLLNVYKNKIIAVKGNCDYDVSLLDFSVEKLYLTIPLDEKMVFLTHGHYYNTNNMPISDYDIYIQGHTHKALLEMTRDKLYLNPGSLTLPRSGVNSYIYYEDGVFMLKDLKNNIVLKEIKI